ncbi:cation transporter [Roseateles sp. LYH14W]|uniref:Cation transporter n=1 Tax=Pelomonas parva TaxID=3299032 RepID=A0ABW7FAE4_9BURK
MNGGKESGKKSVPSTMDANQADDRRILLTVLLINLGQCAGGVAVGVWASSTALIAAALDNLADASVYAVSLYAVGRAAAIKVRAARLSGWLLIALAALLLVEVLRRFFGGEPPLGPAMMVMAAVNAALNLVCLKLLKRHQGDDVNFKASAIFTSNDSIVNLAIVLSGGLVMWWESNLPDLILGLIVAAIAANGGREILVEASEAVAQDGAAAGRD